jgi:hypothetical protein
VTLSLDVYLGVRDRLAVLGYRDDYEWAQGVKPPATALELAVEHAWVVVNSGMRNTVAQTIWRRLRPALLEGRSAATAFRHTGKAAGIDDVWRKRDELLVAFREAENKVAWCETLPWIGGITKYHLAKNLGVDCAKPDRWLVRLADLEGVSVDALCRRLADESGDRVGTVDVVLWRACAVGVLVISAGAIAVADGAPSGR